MDLKKLSVIAGCVTIVLLGVTSCAINDSSNYWKTRQVCIENGGSVMTRWSPNGSIASNCELPQSVVEVD